jgi:hypothetical protein
MADDRTHPNDSKPARTDIYRQASAAIDSGSVRGTRSGKFHKAPRLTSRSRQADGAGGGPAPAVRHGHDAQGGTESAAVKRSRETQRPAGGRRPGEGGSPRGRRGAKRREAELGPGDGALPPDSVPGAVYQHGGGTDRAIDHGGARRGPGGRLRTVATIPTTTGTTDGVDRDARARRRASARADAKTPKGRPARNARRDRATDPGVGKRSGRSAGKAASGSGATRADSRAAKRTRGGDNRPATGRKRTPRSG